MIQSQQNNEDIYLIHACTPVLTRIDNVPAVEREHAKLWQDLFQELRTNPIVMADLVNQVMTEG